MEEIIWIIQQRTRTLQDYRQDIRSAWDDEASKNLNLRYLNPHEDDNQKALTALKQQQQQLEKTDGEIVKSRQYALEAEKFFQKVEHFLQVNEQEVTQAYHSYNLSLEYYAATRSELSQVERLINQANLAGR